MKKRKTCAMVLLIVMVGSLGSGCMTHQGSKDYSSAQAQRALAVHHGTVKRVQYVEIHVPMSGAGALAGGLMGGLFAATIMGGKREAFTTAAGVLAGATAGARAEQERNRRPALELEVELDSGRTVLIVQEQDDVFTVGERVRVIEDEHGRMRVRH